MHSMTDQPAGMAKPVEAKSLSDLNNLADDPPKYPINPTQPKVDSLVLYISRVPGSRDVILSPFKPQLKNVTLQDVANCLYYIHLDEPSDQSPRPSLDSEHSQPTRSSPIARKPVPASAKVAVSIPAKPTTAPEAQTEPVSPSTSSPTRQELVSASGDAPEDRPALPKRPLDQTPPRQQGPIARKPLGPRALAPNQPAQPRRITAESAAPSFGTNSIEARPASSGTTSKTMDEHKLKIPPADVHSQAPQPLSPSKRSKDIEPFTLTVIRRNPTTGGQTNAGKVSSFQPKNPPSLSPDADGTVPISELAGLAPSIASADGPPTINILIETRGYAKFRGFYPTRENIDPRRQRATSSAASSAGGSSDSLAMLRGANGSSSTITTTATTVDEFFTRQLVMAYHKSWTTNLREAFRSRARSNSSSPTDGTETADDKLLPAPPRPAFHSRSDSNGSANSVGSSPTKPILASLLSSPRQEQPHRVPQLVTTPGPGFRPSGYAFTSPWDGICEFRTSSSGRGVKCVHSFGGSEEAEAVHTVVSELRFNLPSTELLVEKGQEVQGKLERMKVDGERKLQEHLNGAGHQRGKSGDARVSAEMDEVEVDGLGLGRERAGGGNRGKRAKLGKLIIHDQGLKMLDLVIAANMGVWWGAWERSF